MHNDVSNRGVYHNRGLLKFILYRGFCNEEDRAPVMLYHLNNDIFPSRIK